MLLDNNKSQKNIYAPEEIYKFLDSYTIEINLFFSSMEGSLKIEKDLINEIGKLRKHLAEKLGFIIPLIKISLFFNSKDDEF